MFIRQMRRALLPAALAAATACGPKGASSPATSLPPSTLTRAPFGAAPDGRPVEVFTLVNGLGMEVRAMTYGAIILSINAPDASGAMGDVVLGYDSLSGYVRASPYFGAVVGRYGNRIARGRFTLDGRAYALAVNNAPNALHGGRRGFDKLVWTAEPVRSDSGVGVEFTLVSPDGDEGYPGTVTARVTYTLLSARNDLVIDYEATTDKATPLNLTNHSYFNLAGAGAGDILGHVLTLEADSMTPVDATLIPTGTMAAVGGTPFDFRTPTAIGARIDRRDSQIINGGGYDHNFVLNRTGPGLVHAAHVSEPTSGRTLDVLTTEPGLQFYSGNFLDGTITGKGGRVYQHRYGLCLETQHFPDSPNRASFPSTILRPGAIYRSQTVYAFGAARQAP
jgi:aldose 1-epimerase